MRPSGVAPRALALLLALGSGLLAACGGGSDGGEGEGGTGSERTTTSGTAGGPATVTAGALTVCSDIPYAPFEFPDEQGRPTGVDVEIVQATAQRLGLRLEVVDVDFDGIFAALAARRCDVIASAVSITPEREASNDFSRSYYRIRQSLLVRKGDEGRYADLASLADRQVGVQSETTGEAYVRENAPPAVRIRSFTGADELFTALEARQIDGIVQDLPVNAYRARTRGDVVVSARFDSAPESYGIVIRQGDTAMKAAVDGALEALERDGGLAAILERFLGPGETTGSPGGG